MALRARWRGGLVTLLVLGLSAPLWIGAPVAAQIEVARFTFSGAVNALPSGTALSDFSAEVVWYRLSGGNIQIDITNNANHNYHIKTLQFNSGPTPGSNEVLTYISGTLAPQSVTTHGANVWGDFDWTINFGGNEGLAPGTTTTLTFRPTVETSGNGKKVQGQPVSPNFAPDAIKDDLSSKGEHATIHFYKGDSDSTWAVPGRGPSNVPEPGSAVVLLPMLGPLALLLRRRRWAGGDGVGGSQ